MANRTAQPLITGLSIAAWQCLVDKLPPPSVVAGYSVGELAAFCAAGVIAPSAGLSLSCERAAVMDADTAGRPMGLLAVHGIRSTRLTTLCHSHGLSIAIRLAHDNYILGGLASSLEVAESELRDLGLRVTRLAISVASHTPWMAEAAAKFAKLLEAKPFSPPVARVVCNLTASAVTSIDDLQRCLAAQIANPILWDACMDTIVERGVRCVLEVGPGTTLAALWRTAHPDVPVRSVEDFRAPEAAVAWVARTLSKP